MRLCVCVLVSVSISVQVYLRMYLCMHVSVSAIIVSQWAILVLWLREALFGDSVD